MRRPYIVVLLGSLLLIYSGVSLCRRGAISTERYVISDDENAIFAAILESRMFASRDDSASLSDTLHYNVATFVFMERSLLSDVAEYCAPERLQYAWDIYLKWRNKGHVFLKYEGVRIKSRHNVLLVADREYSKHDDYFRSGLYLSRYGGRGLIQFSPAVFSADRQSAAVLVKHTIDRQRGRVMIVEMAKNGDNWRVYAQMDIIYKGV